VRVFSAEIAVAVAVAVAVVMWQWRAWIGCVSAVILIGGKLRIGAKLVEISRKLTKDHLKNTIL
jgi:hypothetical protein